MWDLVTKSTDCREGWHCDYLHTRFQFQGIQSRSACTDKTDKTMGFSVQSESVVELQLSRNVIRMKTSSENHKLSRD